MCNFPVDAKWYIQECRRLNVEEIETLCTSLCKPTPPTKLSGEFSWYFHVFDGGKG